MKALIGRLITRTINVLGKRNLLLSFLTLAALLGATTGLIDVLPRLDHRLMLTSIALSYLIGWLLALSAMRPGLGSLLGGVLGLGWLYLRVGHLYAEIGRVFGQLAGLARQVDRFYLTGITPTLDPLQEVIGTLYASIATLTVRVVNWGQSLLIGEPRFDPIAASVGWSLLLWGAGAWAGWVLRRSEKPLKALVPAGALMSITLYYAGSQRSAYFLIYLGAALLLLAATSYVSRARRWEREHVDVAALSAEISLMVVALSVSLVVTAGLAPRLSLQNLIDTISDLIPERASEEGDQLPESLGIESEPREDPFENQRGGSAPPTHTVGPGPELSDEMVMVIQTGDVPTAPPNVPVSDEAPRYYWRSHTYDRYTGHGWSSSDTTQLSYEASEPALATIPAARRKVRQEVQYVGDAPGRLHAAGAIATANRDYTIAWRVEPYDAFQATIDGQSYTVDSYVTTASQAELRATGTDYPDWIVARYLSLPDTVPQRVLATARDLTATEPTPYDRALAIESHLRTYSYTLDVDGPPLDRDTVDYFLFDLQKGYCDYYATSMVVLARAAGLPARIAMGYGSGTYDPYEAEYIITESNAHSWPELYFPEYGWIPFEPTAGEAPLDRPLEEDEPGWSEPVGVLAPATDWWDVRSWPWWVTILAALSTALLIAAGVAWADTWRLSRLRPTATVAILYRRLGRHTDRLRVESARGATPYEFAQSLEQWVDTIIGAGQWHAILSPLKRTAQELTEIHVQASYSQRGIDEVGQMWAITLWHKLRWRLWLAHLWRNRASVDG